MSAAKLSASAAMRKRSRTAMHALEVGKPYLPGRPSLPARVEYNFRSGRHKLLLCLHEPSEQEVREA
jgi:hypothetical protein